MCLCVLHTKTKIKYGRDVENAWAVHSPCYMYLHLYVRQYCVFFISNVKATINHCIRNNDCERGTRFTTIRIVCAMFRNVYRS